VPSLAKGGPDQVPTHAGKIVFSSFMTGTQDLFSIAAKGFLKASSRRVHPDVHTPALSCGQARALR
jgi:hypothetical protein